MVQAYLQLLVDEETKETQAIVTNKKIVKVNRLQFGISIASQIFQKLVDNILTSISGVLSYYDDILMHLQNKNSTIEFEKF